MYPGVYARSTLVGVHPPWYASQYTPLGTPCYTVHHAGSQDARTAATMPGEEALGSTLGLIRDMRRIEAFLSPFLLGLMGSVAQSPSAPPGRKG